MVNHACMQAAKGVLYACISIVTKQRTSNLPSFDGPDDCATSRQSTHDCNSAADVRLDFGRSMALCGHNCQHRQSLLSNACY